MGGGRGAAGRACVTSAAGWEGPPHAAAGFCLGDCHPGGRELGLVELKVEATDGPQVAAALGSEHRCGCPA